MRDRAADPGNKDASAETTDGEEPSTPSALGNNEPDSLWKNSLLVAGGGKDGKGRELERPLQAELTPAVDASRAREPEAPAEADASGAVLGRRAVGCQETAPIPT